MREPIDNWLWLAGEYLFGENMGVASGAHHIGYCAAEQIIKQLS